MNIINHITHHFVAQATQNQFQDTCSKNISISNKDQKK